MRLLLVNDDGIFAPGLHALAAELCKAHELTICAPDHECSGVGHAFTFLSPLRAKRVSIAGIDAPAYAISGMPVDCVKLGLHNLMAQPPDMVISGINSGGNLGADVLYSGTVSAAIEGAILGHKALAVSSVAFPPTHFEPAARLAASLLEKLCALDAPKGTVFNLNVPDLPEEQIKGVRAARLGTQGYDNFYEERADPRGVPYYWLPDIMLGKPEPGTDQALIPQGYASLTPISFDLTRHAFMPALEKMLSE